MAKFKNIMLTGLSLALVAALAIGGTLAYLQDQDSTVNVMTLGNVEIAQHEYQRKEDTDGTYVTKIIDGENSYVLEGFEQAKPLYPIVGDPSVSGDAHAGWDDTAVRMTQVDSYGSMSVFAGKNAQDKFVTVENTGKSDAYIRTLVAVEIGSTDGSLIGTSYHKTWKSTDFDGETEDVQPLAITIDGMNYNLYEYVYAGGQLSDGSWRHEKGALPAGETSYPSLAQIYLKSKATNKDMKDIDGNGNGTLDIIVLSQAVQTAGFEDAVTALNTAFGESNAANAATWFESKKIPVIADKDTESEKVLEALENGQDVFVDKDVDIMTLEKKEINGQGATVTLAGQGAGAYGYLSFNPGAGENATVNDMNVTGAGFVEFGHHGQAKGVYSAKNLTITDMTATLCVNEGGNNISAAFSQYGTATLTDCVMTGTVSAKSDYTAYDAAFSNGTSTTIEAGEFGKIYLAAQAHVTINEAEVDTITSCAITTNNLGMLTIGAGTHVGTINLTPTGTYQPALTIENGAKVDAIIYKGVTYTQDAWINR